MIKIIKWAIIMFLFLVMEMNVALHYLFKVDFLSVAIALSTIFLPWRICIMFSFIAGIIKDALAPWEFPFTTIIYVVGVSAIFYSRKILRAKVFSFVAALLLIPFYIIIQISFCGTFPGNFFCAMTFNSFAAFGLFYFPISRWIHV